MQITKVARKLYWIKIMFTTGRNMLSRVTVAMRIGDSRSLIIIWDFLLWGSREGVWLLRAVAWVVLCFD